jgi:hypothetical protein
MTQQFAPHNSQIARFTHAGPCGTVSAALTSKGYIRPNSPTIERLGLEYPLGCHWTFELNQTVISVQIAELSEGTWSMVVRPGSAVLPRAVARRRSNPEDENRIAQTVYRVAIELHEVLAPACPDLEWVTPILASKGQTRPEPIPP